MKALDRAPGAELFDELRDERTKRITAELTKEAEATG